LDVNKYIFKELKNRLWLSGGWAKKQSVSAA